MQWLWCFNFDYHDSMGALVIWALGWSMVALSGLVFLPLPVITGFGVSLILFHNLFDTVRPESFGAWRWLWMVLHQPGILEPLPGVHFVVLYPLVPWIGVMAAGYGFGQLLVLEPERRRRFLRWMGAGFILAFLILRAWNQYGDARPWSSQSNGLLTALSFLNCSKYPPSLLFLLMTLGPAILFLSWAERPLNAAGRWLVTLRTSAFLLLPASPLSHSCAGDTLRCHQARHGGFPVSNKPDGFPRQSSNRLWVRASCSLSRLDRGHSDSRASLPLVRQPQGPPPGTLAELPVERRRIR